MWSANHHELSTFAVLAKEDENDSCFSNLQSHGRLQQLVNGRKQERLIKCNVSLKDEFINVCVVVDKSLQSGIEPNVTLSMLS